MNALRVGLTGGLAGGKSTVAKWLREEGFEVIDADRLVAEMYQPGGVGAQAVAALFGPGSLDERGAVDHAKVAARVFGDAQARRSLEAAIHPLVRRRYEELAAQAEGVVVLEATLLVEAGYGPGFDLIVTVESPCELRLERAVARGMDEAAARARLLAQGDGEERRRAAHRILDNSGDTAHLRRQTDELIEELRRLAAERPSQEHRAMTSRNENDRATNQQRAYVLQRLEERFAPLPEAVRRRVEEIDSLEELKELGSRIGSAPSLEALGLADEPV